MISNLSHDLVLDIAQRLPFYTDYANFRSINKSLRSIVPKKLPYSIPCLILPFNETHCDFFSLFAGKEGENCNLELPEVQTQLCKGSSHGWLITVGKTPAIHLINPLRSTRMQLPPIDTFPDVLEYNPERVDEEYLISTDYPTITATSTIGCHRDVLHRAAWVQSCFIMKLVLSSSPGGQEGCIAMAIHSECTNKVACCKLGDNEWKTVEGAWSNLDDIIHHNGSFYVLDQYGRIFVISDEEVDSLSPKATLFAAGPEFSALVGDKIYLVVVNGDFLIVNRDRDWISSDNYRTLNFDVFRLNISDSEWSEVQHIGDNFLFLGKNESSCIPTCEIPRSSTGNRIYFTDDHGKGSDIGVFHMEDRIVRKFPLSSGFQDQPSQISPAPIWIEPNA
ncbi:hypothetical protein ACHQM5_012112 [Ranunculus cassubicifolius]